MSCRLTRRPLRRTSSAVVNSMSYTRNASADTASHNACMSNKPRKTGGGTHRSSSLQLALPSPCPGASLRRGAPPSTPWCRAPPWVVRARVRQWALDIFIARAPESGVHEMDEGKGCVRSLVPMRPLVPNQWHPNPRRHRSSTILVCCGFQTPPWRQGTLLHHQVLINCRTGRIVIALDSREAPGTLVFLTASTLTESRR